MATRSKSRDKLGYVVECEIEKDLSCGLSLRKNDTYFYISIVPEDIKNEQLRTQYERRAEAARQESIAFQEYCNGSQDSGYSSGGEEDEFHDWIQQPLVDTLSKHKGKKPKTLKEWYQVDVHCFSLKASDDWEIEDLDVDPPSYTPHMKLPKYLTTRKELNWVSPNDIEVLEEEHNIHMAIHPTLVRVNGKTCFLKLVAEGQEPAVKREIKMLADFVKLDLDIRAPRLEGVVGSPDGILGFLLQIVPGCVPLVKLMTSEISQSKRDSWAREVKRQVKVLHEHKMLWGDAKADNFLVDEDDQVWIIDFGGSYTVGWMDPEKFGTRRGEDEAVKLIVDGVKDPDNCTLVEETQDKPPSHDKKRKRNEQDHAPRKVKKTS